MAIGVAFGRRPIQGSCGGVARLGLGGCEICGGDPTRCERTPDVATPHAEGRPGDTALGYDATRPARRDF
jgi:hypothetical protein